MVSTPVITLDGDTLKLESSDGFASYTTLSDNKKRELIRELAISLYGKTGVYNFVSITVNELANGINAAGKEC
jgi:hypothetical protein